MKYGKLLQTLLEEMPAEYRDKFLSYKQLKKRIKQFLDSNSFPEAAFEPAPVAPASGEQEQQRQLHHAPAVPGSGENSGAVHDDNLADEKVRWSPAILKTPATAQGTPALAMAVSALMDMDEEEEATTTEGNTTEPIVGSTKRKRAAAEEASVRLGRGESHGLEKGETSESAQEGRGGGGGGGGGGVREKTDGGSGSDTRRDAAPETVRHFLDAVSRQGITGRGQAMGEDKEVTPEEEEFIRLLNVELEKFNSFFTEKEEDYVIQLQELKDRLKNARVQHRGHTHNSEELLRIHTDLVTFHGDVVLMESYSALNYMGLVKILKKHDKRTGAVLRLPFIRRVLLQPFFSTELLSKLVQECESLLSFFPASPIVECIDVERVDGEGADFTGEVPKDIEELLLMRGEDVQSVYKSSLAALRTLQEMRKGSSTVSSQSLPPCNILGNDERFSAVLNDRVWPTPTVFVSQAE